MLRLGTLATLAELEEEMVRNGRMPEAAALGEARRLLAGRRHGLLTTGEAAERLGVSIPTVRRWIERGALDGARIEGRWLVAAEGVDRLVSVRKALQEVASEGFPSDDELRSLLERAGRSSERVPTASM
jgi:excisionase family DNA binding protein